MDKDEIAVSGAPSEAGEDEIFALIPLPDGERNARVDTGNLVVSRQAQMVDGQFRLDTGAAARKITCYVDAPEGEVTDPVAVRIRYIGRGGPGAQSSAMSLGTSAADLEAPTVIGAVGGVLNPDLLQVKVSVPNYDGKALNDDVTMHWQAVNAPFEDEFKVSQPFLTIPIEFTVRSPYIKPNEGTTVNVSYSVKSSSGASKGDSIVTSVAIGEQTVEPGAVPPPEIEGVSGGVLNLATVPSTGAPATVEQYEGMGNGDTVYIEITGQDGSFLWDTYKRIPQDSPVGQPVPFVIPKAELQKLSGRAILVSTRVFGGGGGDPRESIALPVRVLEPLGELPVVEVTGAQGNALDPEAVTGPFVEVVVKPYPGIAEGDTIRFRWVNATGAPPTFDETEVAPANPQQDYVFEVPRAHVDQNIDKTATLSYTVVRGTDAPKPSVPMTLYIGEAFEAAATLDATGKNYILAEKPPLEVPEFGTYLREAKFGTAPYTYASSDESVASVDNTTGQVTARGNGSATITATDSTGDALSYPITVTGVLQLFFVSPSASFSGAQAACDAAGLRVVTLDEMKAFWRTYYPSTGPVAAYMEWLSYPFWTGTTIGAGTAYSYDLNGSSEQGNASGRNEADFMQVVGIAP
ncbi:Ig-like domain-containing protein [Pandoraea sp. NPDC087047]|uniref:Ig-like domain-containing protein n=1 Tax=Pandoraea sp. NPDC087047 TaxID=3364390 RepID=UPI0038299848